MAEECPTVQVPTIKEDDTQMESEMSEMKSAKADDSLSEKGALTLPVSGATSAAASTPVSDSESAMSPGDVHAKAEVLTLPVSGATSAAVSTSVSYSEGVSSEDIHLKVGALTLPVSGSTSAAASISVSEECATSPKQAHVKEGALTLPVSGATSAAASTPVSDSGCAMSDTHVKELAADPSDPPEATAATPVSGSTAGNLEMMSAEKVAEMLSPEKEKVGIFKGVKTAIKTKVKSVWKKLSPKKSEKASLAASAQEADSKEASAPETEKKPIKVVTYVSATRGSLVLNSVASDEVTLDTDLPTSASEVFFPDEDSVATCDTATHASRLPSLGESCSEPSEESPKHDAEESSGDRGDNHGR